MKWEKGRIIIGKSAASYFIDVLGVRETYSILGLTQGDLKDIYDLLNEDILNEALESKCPKYCNHVHTENMYPQPCDKSCHQPKEEKEEDIVTMLVTKENGEKELKTVVVETEEKQEERKKRCVQKECFVCDSKPLTEPSKKPSTVIKEIINERIEEKWSVPRCEDTTPDYERMRIDAVISYLDYLNSKGKL